MLKAASIVEQAATGNRFALILLHSQLRRADSVERAHQLELRVLRRRRMWITPDGPRKDDPEADRREGAGQEAPGQEGRQDQSPGASA